MRKIILGMAVSLDGMIEGPHGEFDWCFTDQDYGMGDFLKKIDVVFYGRKTYELMMKWDGGNPFGNKKSYVFSNTWREPAGDFELVRGDVVDAVRKMKSAEGKDIWLFGGASLTAFLMGAEMVDELWLSVHPIVLGEGKPLFSGLRKRAKLTLLESKPYDTGLVSLRYQVMHTDGA